MTLVTIKYKAIRGKVDTDAFLFFVLTVISWPLIKQLMMTIKFNNNKI